MLPCSALCNKKENNKTLSTLEAIPDSLPKRTQFEKDLDKFDVNLLETYFNVLLNPTKANTKTYWKEIQHMYKMIKVIDRNALIIKYKGEEIIEKNKSGVAVKAKDAFLNYTKAISNFLWQIHEYLPNGRPNGKCIFTKMRLTYSIEPLMIILTLKEVIEDMKFYIRLRLIQYWDISTIE